MHALRVEGRGTQAYMCMFVCARVPGRVLCVRVRLLCVHASVMSTSKLEASLYAADLRFIFDEHTVAKNHRCFDSSSAIVQWEACSSLVFAETRGSATIAAY